MPNFRIEYGPKYQSTPMSFWVHRNLDSDAWVRSKEFDPPLPAAIPCRGFPRLVVKALGTELEFASLAEAKHFLEVISQKNMPTSRQLSRQRTEAKGPNSHWLSRLPANLKPWSKRQKLIPIIKAGIRALQALYR